MDHSKGLLTISILLDVVHVINWCQTHPSGNATVSQIIIIVRRNLSLLLFLHQGESFFCSPCSFFFFSTLNSCMFLSLLSLILSLIHSFKFFKEPNYSLYLTIYHFVLLQSLLKAQFFQDVFLEEQKVLEGVLVTGCMGLNTLHSEQNLSFSGTLTFFL